MRQLTFDGRLENPFTGRGRPRKSPSRIPAFRPPCEHCSKKMKPSNNGQDKTYHRVCRRCRDRGKAHRIHITMICDVCGFVGLHPSQLDVHHRDGNRNNDAPDNLQTLCPPCHRLYHPTIPDGEKMLAFIKKHGYGPARERFILPSPPTSPPKKEDEQ